MLLVMGIRQSHATDVLVSFYSNPVMPTISCRKAACHTDMEDIKDDTTAQGKQSSQIDRNGGEIMNTSHQRCGELTAVGTRRAPRRPK